MEKRIKNKRKIIYSVCIIVIIVIVSAFAYYKYIKNSAMNNITIEGISSPPQGKVVNLGIYDNKKIYTGYTGYILNNNSNYNLIKIFGIQLKYPKDLVLSGLTTENAYLTNGDANSNLMFHIKVVDNNNNKSTKDYMNYLVESSKQYIEANLPKDNHPSYSYKENKIFVTFKSNSSNPYGFFREYLLKDNKVFAVNLTYQKPTATLNDMTNTIINSFA